MVFRIQRVAVIPFALLLIPVGLIAAEGKQDSSVNAPDGWKTGAPREEIRPSFAYESTSGLNGTDSLVIKADGREGLDGFWAKAFPVIGGKHYQFAASYRASNVAVP